MNMKQESHMTQGFAENSRSDMSSLLNLLLILAKYKRTIFRTTVAAVVLSTGGSLLLPDVYEATTKLLPPQQNQSTATMLLSQLGGMAGAAAGIAGLKSPNDMYVGMLKSRTIADGLIVQFDLKKVYDVETFEKARKILENRTDITSGKDGLITIEVEDYDKKLVAQLAGAYVTKLDDLTKSLAITDASQRRVFFESELLKAKNNLANAETLLKTTINTHGVQSVDIESRGILETSARIKAQISAKQIELNSMRAFMTERNPDYRRIQEELYSLQAEAAKLENGRTDGSSRKAEDEKNGGLESIKLVRDVKYYQMLYELLAKQYEVARLDEAKDPSIIQILDHPVEPERKSKPHRSLIVMLAGVVAFLGSCFYALGRETFRRMNATPDGEAKLTQIKAYLRGK